MSISDETVIGTPYQADCRDPECCTQWWVEMSDGTFRGFDTEEEVQAFVTGAGE